MGIRWTYIDSGVIHLDDRLPPLFLRRLVERCVQHGVGRFRVLVSAQVRVGILQEVVCKDRNAHSSGAVLRGTARYK